jgi:hypothetical protein
MLAAPESAMRLPRTSIIYGKKAPATVVGGKKM